MVMPPIVTQLNYRGIHVRGQNPMVMPLTLPWLNYREIHLRGQKPIGQTRDSDTA